mgnify:CR=1 FL=1
MSDESTASKPRGADRFTYTLLALLLLGAGAAFVAWRRARNPLRMWAAQVEQGHARELEQPLARCLGTLTGEGVRRLAAQVQRGDAPAPFKDCHRGHITELLIAPNAFVSSMQHTPLEVYNVRERERVALQRLSTSIRQLEHAVTGGGASPTAAQRQEIARKLEDLAPDVEQERNTFADLIAAARDQAGAF